MTSPSIGSELRRWRELRALSQLALATQAEVSTRHVSYVENGRSRPTPEMIVRLAEVMAVPMGEQNRLLLAGGFAPRYPHRTTDDEALAPMMAGLRSLLDAHAPYPALLLDDHWDIVDANRAVDALLTGCDPSLLEPPLNVIRLCLHPLGLAASIRNLPVWRAHLLHQLGRRITHTGGDPDLVALRDEVDAYPVGDAPTARPQVDPVVPLEIEVGDQVLRLFSVASQIESASDVTLNGLHLETFVPADDRTRQVLSR
ncbi:transcriptional regulator with XRE-family HTH domain [Nocardioides albertanoniae]|uniref:Transcriptional regulator with XRE-family HTH domain n=2 Tax=Nocardioides albertanoniae TaxID=1175486 RepID=A0A543AAZ3_9ACTN|nr:transcriptional regulator with XRE-family HTH domain [Nocardioides albertanoniae]